MKHKIKIHDMEQGHHHQDVGDYFHQLSQVICEGPVRKGNKSEPIKTLLRCQHKLS